MWNRALRDQLPLWIAEMRNVASTHPTTGACTVATAIELWKWTFDRFERDSEGKEQDAAALADALGLLLSSRAFVLQISDLGPGPEIARDLCQAHVAKSCGEAGRILAELVFGSIRHPAWDRDAGMCYRAEEIEELEEYVPGLSSCARVYGDVIESDGSHKPKAGPCLRFDGIEDFVRLRTKLDGCLAGARVARERAIEAIAGKPVAEDR